MPTITSKSLSLPEARTVLQAFAGVPDVHVNAALAETRRTGLVTPVGDRATVIFWEGYLGTYSRKYHVVLTVS
jgi:hypothetical protein